MHVRYCITSWNKSLRVCSYLIAVSLRPHEAIYTHTVQYTHWAESRHQRENSSDLTFTGLDNQITWEEREGLRGRRTRLTGKLLHVFMQCVNL